MAHLFWQRYKIQARYRIAPFQISPNDLIHWDCYWDTANSAGPDWQLDTSEGVLGFQIQNNHELGYFQGQLFTAFHASARSVIAFEE